MKNRFAWLLQQILNYVKILGPILVVILSSLDFAKAIITSDDDSMKKSRKKACNSLSFGGCFIFNSYTC